MARLTKAQREYRRIITDALDDAGIDWSDGQKSRHACIDFTVHGKDHRLIYCNTRSACPRTSKNLRAQIARILRGEDR